MGPCQQGDGGTGVASVVPESSDTLSRRVGEELDVVQYATSAGEAVEVIGPAFLAFVAVTKLDVRVNERNCEKGECQLDFVSKASPEARGGGRGRERTVEVG